MIVYSPLDAVTIARDNPAKQVVFFGIGFETTAPANAMAVDMAKRQGLKNFSMLVSHVLVPPAIEAIMTSPSCRVQAFLAAGHVCSVMGTWQYPPLAEKYHVPIVVTGFEPLDVLEGIRRAVAQLEAGEARVDNAYARAVTTQGNLPAQKLLEQVFEVTDRGWRGIGTIPLSGWRLRDAYAGFDAERRFDVLVCTAIVEAGLDMPNVNTILVDHADEPSSVASQEARRSLSRARWSSAATSWPSAATFARMLRARTTEFWM